MESDGRLEQILCFLEVCDQLKAIRRASYLTTDDDHETVAAHTWHSTLFAPLLYDGLTLDVDLEHVLTLLTIHDLVEIDAGDTFGYDTEGQRTKAEREASAADRLFEILPSDLTTKLRSWWEEYATGATLEARDAMAIDRLQALAHNVATGGCVWRERGVTEAMSRAKNRQAMAFDPWIADVFEALYQRADRNQLWPASPLTK